jgi:hypothetical protein
MVAYATCGYYSSYQAFQTSKKLQLQFTGTKRPTQQTYEFLQQNNLLREAKACFWSPSIQQTYAQFHAIHKKWQKPNPEKVTSLFLEQMRQQLTILQWHWHNKDTCFTQILNKRCKMIWVRLFYDDASKRGIDYVTSSNLWHRSNVRGCSFTHSPVSRTGGSPWQGKKEQVFPRMGLSLVGCEGHSTDAPA